MISNMEVIEKYSFKGGESFLRSGYPGELEDVLTAIKNLDAVECLTKESKERTMKGKLLFSPKDMNDLLKTALHKKGWTEKAAGKRKEYIEPRHSFGSGRFREMDGIKNRVGLEVQFGKYAFMGYDIFSKMVIFKNLGYITCGIEVVPSQELVRNMSTGVSSFNQLLVDFEHRGESNIDIPVLVIGIGLTKSEEERKNDKQKEFKRTKKVSSVKLRGYRGSRPGLK